MSTLVTAVICFYRAIQAETALSPHKLISLLLLPLSLGYHTANLIKTDVLGFLMKNWHAG